MGFVVSLEVKCAGRVRAETGEDALNLKPLSQKALKPKPLYL